jgi:TIR domain
MMMPPMPRHVFISYVREDSAAVDDIASNLRRNGIEVWLDRDQIMPGRRWRDAIRHAIGAGAMFVACFSANYLKRERSHMNEELTLAIDELRSRPADRVWFVPVVLSDGSVPDRRIGAGETLRDLQWIDFTADWQTAINLLVSIAREATAPKAGGDPSTLRVVDTYESEITAIESRSGGYVDIPDHLFLPILTRLVATFSLRFEAISYDDLDFWVPSDAYVQEYLDLQRRWVSAGTTVTRLFLLSRRQIAQDRKRVIHTLRTQMDLGIAVAIAILEDIPHAPQNYALDSLMLDGGKVVALFSQTGRRRVRLASPTGNRQSQPDKLVRSQTALYTKLLKHCALASEAFTTHSLHREVLGTALEQPVIVTKNRDDVEIAVDKLHKSFPA